MSAVSTRPNKAMQDKEKVEQEILNQNWFKSVGPRTYAAQVKKAGNGNHFLVLTEGRRDEKTGEVRKNRIFLFSEDFAAFFKMMHETATFIRQHPVPEKIRRRQEKRWAKNRDEAHPGAKAGDASGKKDYGTRPPAKTPVTAGAAAS